MRTIVSLCPRDSRPAGTSWLAARIAFITWSSPMPSAVSALGLICTRICRVTLPCTSMRATPGTFSRPLTIVWSVRDVSSRRPVACDITASDTTGSSLSVSARTTSGSFASRGKPGRTAATLSRTSCIARIMSVSSRNSTNTELTPSAVNERTSLTPVTPLTAFSTGLVMSISTASGDAPGYCVCTIRNGSVTSGICSTRSREYENRPSTVIPIITIVAKTGLLIETRVIHMSGISRQMSGIRGGGDSGGGASSAAARRLRVEGRDARIRTRRRRATRSRWPSAATDRPP